MKPQTLLTIAFTLYPISAISTPNQAPSIVLRTFDEHGKLVATDGARTDVSDITHYSYDEKGNLNFASNALKHTFRLSDFDTYGNPGAIVDPNGTHTTIRYTPSGWLSSVSTGSHITKFYYNETGDLTKAILSDGSSLKYTYDDARRLTGIENTSGDTINYTLDLMGNRTRTETKNAFGKTTRVKKETFDELGQRLSISKSRNHSYKYSYDLNGNITTITTPLGHRTIRSFDQHNRLAKQINTQGGVTEVSYRDDNLPTKLVEMRSLSTQLHYDSHGNLTHQISPDSGTSTYIYDSASNLIRHTDARGITTQHTYDALNRLTHTSYPDNPSLSAKFIYDSIENGNKGIGRLTSIEDSTGSTHYIYNEHGYLTKKSQTLKLDDHTIKESLHYHYNSGGKLSTIDYSDQVSIEHSHNTSAQINNLTLIINGVRTPLAQNIIYEPFGPMSQLTLGNKLILDRQFDDNYRLTKQTIGNLTSAYNYDADGNTTRIDHSLFGSRDYKYDSLNRITMELSNSLHKQYHYDASGNRIKRTSHSLLEKNHSDTQTLTYKIKSNRLATVDNKPVRFDAAGNITSINKMNYKYDVQGRLSEAHNGDIKVSDYLYNAHNARTIKKIHSPHTNSGINFTTYTHDNDGKLLRQTNYDNNGVSRSARYWIWLDNLPLAQLDVELENNGKISNSRLVFLHSDQLSTPRMATDARGTLVWSWDSDVFGLGNPNEDVDGNGENIVIDLRMPGQLWDSHSKLSYNYFRDYAPEIGQYIQSDPIGLRGGLNTYTYASGNPLRDIDPKGLNPIVAAVAGSAVLPGPRALMGAALGAAAVMMSDLLVTEEYTDPVYAKPPENAYDPEGPKAPGKPTEEVGFKDPKGGESWVPNPNPGKGGSSHGWLDAKGDVWCPSGLGGRSHGGPHWDVQSSNGDYRNVRPIRK